MVTGEQTQHVLHREQCTKTILWSNIDVTMPKGYYFEPEYCVGNSDTAVILLLKVVCQSLCQPALRLKPR